MAVDHNNPQSRTEEILIATIDGEEYDKLPQSRLEELLLELKQVIEEGGGGGGTTNYNNLSNRPKVNDITLEGNKSAADLSLVLAEVGKGLSTNDYSDEEKAKVANLLTAIEGILTGSDIDSFGDVETALSEMKDGVDIDSFGDVEVALLDKADTSDLVSAVNEVKSGLTNLDNEVNGDATVYPYSDVITIEDAVPANLADCSVKIEPVQDLHGYDHPWVGGANVNLLPSLVPGTYEKDGIIVTVDNNGNMNISGTKTASAVTINVPLTSPIDISANYYLHMRNDVSDSNVVTMGITLSGTNRIAVMYDMQGVQNCVVYIASVATLNINVRLSIEKTNNVTDWSPYENICPITGHTEASVQRDGVNRISEMTSGVYSSSTGEKISHVAYCCSNKFVVEPNTVYTASATASESIGSDNGVLFWDKDGKYLGQNTGGIIAISSFPYTFTVPANAYYCALDVNIGISSLTMAQLELGSTATPYEPYAGKTYTISLGDTIYGGTVDFDSGVMTVTHSVFDLGDKNWASTSIDGNACFYTTISDKTYSEDEKCSHFAYSLRVSSDNTFSTNLGGATQVYVRDEAYSDPADFKTAMSGAKMSYRLATPTTIQLTPQQIQLLKGTNTISASTGQISVTVNGVSGSIGAVQAQANATDAALAELAEQLPDAPTTDGAYVLTVTVADGTPTYSWESAS